MKHTDLATFVNIWMESRTLTEVARRFGRPLLSTLRLANRIKKGGVHIPPRRSCFRTLEAIALELTERHPATSAEVLRHELERLVNCGTVIFPSTVGPEASMN